MQNGQPRPSRINAGTYSGTIKFQSFKEFMDSFKVENNIRHFLMGTEYLGIFLDED